LIEIINKQLLLQLVGYLCYWQMGFNSVFKGLNLVENISIARRFTKCGKTRYSLTKQFVLDFRFLRRIYEV